jgi:hypothetical protein
VEETFRLSAPLGRRVTQARVHVAFCFKAAKGGIDSPDGDIATNAHFNFLSHGDSVGVITETQERENDNVLEFAEIITAGH